MTAKQFHRGAPVDIPWPARPAEDEPFTHHELRVLRSQREQEARRPIQRSVNAPSASRAPGTFSGTEEVVGPTTYSAPRYPAMRDRDSEQEWVAARDWRQEWRRRQVAIDERFDRLDARQTVATISPPPSPPPSYTPSLADQQKKYADDEAHWMRLTKARDAEEEKRRLQRTEIDDSRWRARFNERDEADKKSLQQWQDLQTSERQKWLDEWQKFRSPPSSVVTAPSGPVFATLEEAEKRRLQNIEEQAAAILAKLAVPTPVPSTVSVAPGVVQATLSPADLDRLAKLEQAANEIKSRLESLAKQTVTASPLDAARWVTIESRLNDLSTRPATASPLDNDRWLTIDATLRSLQQGQKEEEKKQQDFRSLLSRAPIAEAKLPPEELARWARIEEGVVDMRRAYGSELKVRQDQQKAQRQADEQRQRLELELLKRMEFLQNTQRAQTNNFVSLQQSQSAQFSQLNAKLDQLLQRTTTLRPVAAPPAVLASPAPAPVGGDDAQTQAKLDRLQASVDPLFKRIDDLQKRIDSLNPSSVSSAMISKLQTTLDSVASGQQSLADTRKILERVETKLDTYSNKQQTSAKVDLTPIASQLQALSDRIGPLAATVDAWRAQLTASNTATLQGLAAVKDQIATLQTQTLSPDAIADSVRKANAPVQEAIRKLQKEIETKLTQTVGDFEAIYNGIAQRISKLVQNIDSATKAGIEDAIGKVKTSIDALPIAAAQLEAVAGQLSSTPAKVIESTNNLSDAVARLRAALSELVAPDGQPTLVRASTATQVVPSTASTKTPEVTPFVPSVPVVATPPASVTGGGRSAGRSRREFPRATPAFPRHIRIGRLRHAYF